MRVQFLRHAESIFNATGASEKNCSLSEKGIEQARALYGDFDVIVCSELRRTHETLVFSQLKAGKIVYTLHCREQRKDRCDFLEEEDETELESDEDTQARCQRFSIWLKSNFSSFQTILIVSHRDFIYHMSDGQYKLGNAERIALDI